MEEDKKEEVKEVGACCGKHHHRHACCGHKAIKMAIIAIAVFIIFSIGVCVGRHGDYREGRNFERGNFEQMGGRMNGAGMMRGLEADVQGEAGGCRFKNAGNQTTDSCPMQHNQVQAETISISAPSTCPMQAAQQTQIVVPTPFKTVTPIK